MTTEDGSTARPLIYDGHNDYILRPEHSSVWIAVDNISVYVNRTDEGVVVDLYPNGHETDEPIATTYAFFTDGEIEL